MIADGCTVTLANCYSENDAVGLGSSADSTSDTSSDTNCIAIISISRWKKGSVETPMRRITRTENKAK